MEPPSAPAHRGHVPWHRLLLAVSLLSFWNLPATAQITIESVPFNVAEGSDVLLLAHNATEDTLGYSWYRGETVENNQLIVTYRIDTQANTQGPTYSGREIIYPNGSLLFQNATQNDTGYYTLMVTKNDLQREIVTGLLRVYPVLPRPIITSNNPNPVEHEDTVVLTCEPETQHTTYRWWINNQSLSNSTRLQLSEDNRTLTLFNVTRNDTGPYECETQNPVSATRSDPFTLNVIHPVAKPIIEANSTTVTEHEDTVVLKCLTNDTGVSLRWLFNGQSLLLAERIKLSQDNSTLTIEPVRREDAGNYQCEASNLGNSNKSDPLRLDVKFDSAPGSSSGLSGGAIAGIVMGVLAGVALIAGLVYFLFIRKIGGASDQRQLTENKSSDFNHIQDHSDKLSKKIDEVTYSSLNFNAQESKKPTSALPSPSATETVYTEVKKK